MTKKITDTYCTWLSKYAEQRDCLHKAEAISLINKITRVTSLETLQSILPSHTKQHDNYSILGHNTADCFTKQLSIFTEQVNKTAAVNITAICSKLSRIYTDDRTKDVIALLNEVLADPQMPLYNRASSLLSMLEDYPHDELQKIINHLAKQPHALPTKNAPRGSFAALIPHSKIQKTCLDLLNNNAKTIATSGTLGADANILLQSLLILYEDMHTPQDEEVASKKSSCVIC